MLPFLKWAGGKRWLTDKLHEWVPSHYNTYFEPFLGGGAAFFHLRPERAVLSDCNADLIRTYKAIRHHPAKVREALEKHDNLHDDVHYYKVRSQDPRDEIDLAARFLYLNRTCWNGLYRVNLKGKFNVPRGTKDLILLPGERLEDVAKVLEDAEIICCDFQLSISKAGAGDLVYVDPPYTVKHNLNGFVKYNQSIFSWDDQVRLKEACFAARSRGATVIVSNADHASLHTLYKHSDSLLSVSRASVIAGKTSARQPTTELLALLRGEP